jgi:hypothetical protein
LFNANEFNQVTLPSFIDTTESDLPFMDDTRNESKISLIGIVNVKFYDCKIGCKYQYLR